MSIPTPSGLFGGPVFDADTSSDARELFESSPDLPNWPLKGNIAGDALRGHMLRRMALNGALQSRIDYPLLMYYSTMLTAATHGGARKEFVEAVALGAQARMDSVRNSGMYDRYVQPSGGRMSPQSAVYVAERAELAPSAAVAPRYLRPQESRRPTIQPPSGAARAGSPRLW